MLCKNNAIRLDSLKRLEIKTRVSPLGCKIDMDKVLIPQRRIINRLQAASLLQIRIWRPN
jgi:hypothetical protein